MQHSPHTLRRSSFPEVHHGIYQSWPRRKQEIAKKRTRRTVKHQRAIVGASLDVIKERRAQRPEARNAARAAAVKEGKEKKAAAESKKKAEKAKSAAAGARGQAAKVSKQGAKGAAPKVQASGRR
jgi:large subunit ribosomal protein L24e